MVCVGAWVVCVLGRVCGVRGGVCGGVCGVLGLWEKECIVRSALLSGYLGKSGHLPRFLMKKLAKLKL